MEDLRSPRLSCSWCWYFLIKTFSPLTRNFLTRFIECCEIEVTPWSCLRGYVSYTVVYR